MLPQTLFSLAVCRAKQAGDGPRFLGVFALGLATATATLLAGL
jgi:hypothetical protein